jgi:hypothetical protein
MVKIVHPTAGVHAISDHKKEFNLLNPSNGGRLPIYV